KNCAHMRLAIALAKNGFFGAVSQSASTGRSGWRGPTLGASPWRNLGGRILAESGNRRRLLNRAAFSETLIVPPLRIAIRGLPSGLVFMKKAAMCQYSFCLKSVNGWLWH